MGMSLKDIKCFVECIIFGDDIIEECFFLFEN